MHFELDLFKAHLSCAKYGHFQNNFQNNITQHASCCSGLVFAPCPIHFPAHCSGIEIASKIPQMKDTGEGWGVRCYLQTTPTVCSVSSVFRGVGLSRLESNCCFKSGMSPAASVRMRKFWSCSCIREGEHVPRHPTHGWLTVDLKPAF